MDLYEDVAAYNITEPTGTNGSASAYVDSEFAIGRAMEKAINEMVYAPVSKHYTNP